MTIPSRDPGTVLEVDEAYRHCPRAIRFREAVGNKTNHGVIGFHAWMAWIQLYPVATNRLKVRDLLLVLINRPTFSL